MVDGNKTLAEKLLKVGERVAIPCPDGIKGCAVLHFRIEPHPTCKEAADRIEAQAAEIQRLREALNYAWDLIEEASYSDSVMGVKQDRFLSTYYDENGLRAALGETE